MAIHNDEQVLPNGAFEEFDDFGDKTESEEIQEDNRKNEEQELNNKDTIRLQGDPDPEDINIENSGDSDESTQSDDDDDNSIDYESDDTDTVNEIDDTNQNPSDDPNVDQPNKKQTKEKAISKKEKFERYSRSVQRRINKEVKQREILRAENAQLTERLARIENKLNTEEQASEEQILANRIRNATSIKQQLLEDGEYQQVTKVDNDIMQMKIQQSKMNDRLEYQRNQQNNNYRNQPQSPQPYNSAYTPQQGNNQPAPSPVPDIQTKWIQGNRRFGQDKPYTKYVNDTYDILMDEGYDPESASLYAELDKRIGRKRSAVTKQRSRPQSAPTPNTSSAQKSARSKGLTEADKSNMRNWGLDPTDVNVRKEWLANKRNRA